MAGAHRADAIRGVLEGIIRDLEIQRNSIALAGANLEVSVGKLRALGEWEREIDNSVIVLTEALPKDMRNAIEKYDRAMNWLVEIARYL